MASTSDLLRGKAALVTGSSRGIGRAIAEAFAQAGCHVIANARKPDSLNGWAADLGRRTGSTVDCVYFDVSDPVAVRQGFGRVANLVPRLDVLVNNAGLLKEAPFAMSSVQMIAETFGVNTYGSIYCAQFASRLMARQKAGSIINLASIIGIEGAPGQSAYGASKAAIIGLTASLGKELGPLGIRVNAIAPGFIETDMTGQLPEDRAANVVRQIPFRRAGRADEVAQVCLFLASDMSSYVTGQVIGVDGGMVV